MDDGNSADTLIYIEKQAILYHRERYSIHCWAQTLISQDRALKAAYNFFDYTVAPIGPTASRCTHPMT